MRHCFPGRPTGAQHPLSRWGAARLRAGGRCWCTSCEDPSRRWRGTPDRIPPSLARGVEKAGRVTLHPVPIPSRDLTDGRTVQGAALSGHRVGPRGRTRGPRRSPCTAAPGPRPRRCRPGRRGDLAARSSTTRRSSASARSADGSAGGGGGGAVRTSRTACRSTARTVGSSRAWRSLWVSVSSRRVITLRGVVRTAGGGDQGALGQAVVERGRSSRVGVSRAAR
jgi:hypothetical protein